MPKGRKPSVKGGDSCNFPFHTLYNGNLVAGQAGVPVAPNASITPRGLIEADAWAHFRVKSFMFRLLPVGTFVSAGYVGGVQDSPPATVNQVAELLPSCLMTVNQLCPTEWVRVGKSDLAGPFPWYKSLPGAADPTEEAPGLLFICGSGTDAFYLEIRGVLEFKTSVASANTPWAVTARNRAREERTRAMLNNERSLLMKILSASPAGTAQSQGGTTLP